MIPQYIIPEGDDTVSPSTTSPLSSHADAGGISLDYVRSLEDRVERQNRRINRLERSIMQLEAAINSLQTRLP